MMGVTGRISSEFTMGLPGGLLSGANLWVFRSCDLASQARLLPQNRFAINGSSSGHRMGPETPRPGLSTGRAGATARHMTRRSGASFGGDWRSRSVPILTVFDAALRQ